MEAQLESEDEKRVGITEFISKGSQILAISKYMLTDFIVNEIDLNGNLVTVKRKPQPFDAAKKQQHNYTLEGQLLLQTKKLLGQETAKEIQALYQKLDTGEKISKWQHQFEAPKDKEVRTAIHNFVREMLTCIDSSTVDGKIKLQFKKNLKKMNPLSRKKYIHFTLLKSNVDTAGAIYKLSKVTGINQKLFSTAGLKDKRGVTTQRVSLYNYELIRLTKFYQFWDKNREIWIDDFLQFQNDKIGVGDLKGNQFALILRCLENVGEKDVQERVNSLRDVGMVNYFGMQRFGSYKTKTHQIGIGLIRKQWQQVVQKLILQDTGSANINTLKQELYYGKAYSEAERSLPNRNKVEKMLFRGLVRFGENYLNVFDSLPRGMKTIYVHAVQSYIWNRITSKRIQQHGMKVVIGDLVGVTVGKKQKIGKEEKEQPNDQNQKIEYEDEQQANQEDDDEDQNLKLEVINENNICRYTVHDLVAPLYGPNSKVPENSILSKYIDEELKSLNLEPKDFLENSKLLCFKGNFRKMIIKPESVQFGIISHADKKQQLQTGFYTLGEKVETKQGNYKSIQLILRLPKSSYATMAIRQILHIPSSLQIQKFLNSKYQETGLGQSGTDQKQ